MAHHLGGKDSGGTFQQELAWKFGQGDAFGIYASAYYGKNNNMAQAPAPNSKYVPADPTLAQATDLRDVGPLISTRYKYSLYTSQIERYGGTLSLDWQGDTSALYARAIYGSYGVTGTQDQSSARLETYRKQPTAVRGGYFNTHDIDETLATLQLGGRPRLIGCVSITAAHSGAAPAAGRIMYPPACMDLPRAVSPSTSATPPTRASARVRRR